MIYNNQTIKASTSHKSVWYNIAYSLYGCIKQHLWVWQSRYDLTRHGDYRRHTMNYIYTVPFVLSCIHVGDLSYLSMLYKLTFAMLPIFCKTSEWIYVIISFQICDGPGSLNYSAWKKITRLSCIVNTMVADELTTTKPTTFHVLSASSVSLYVSVCLSVILADDNFKCLFLNDRIPIRISLKYVTRSPINNEPALV